SISAQAIAISPPAVNAQELVNGLMKLAGDNRASHYREPLADRLGNLDLTAALAKSPLHGSKIIIDNNWSLTVQLAEQGSSRYVTIDPPHSAQRYTQTEGNFRNGMAATAHALQWLLEGGAEIQL